MEQKGANGGGFGLSNPLCQPLHEIPEDHSPVNFPPAVQSAEDRVADCNRHPGRLVRVEDRNHKLQQSPMSVDPAVAHRVSILGVHLMHEPPFMVARRPVGQPGPSPRKSIRLPPQIRRPELWSIPNHRVEHIRALQ